MLPSPLRVQSISLEIERGLSPACYIIHSFFCGSEHFHFWLETEKCRLFPPHPHLLDAVYNPGHWE